MLNYFTQFALRISRPLRHPFKTIQQYIGIEEEWKQTKILMRPHRFKMFFLLGILGFPFYKDFFQSIKLFSYSTVQNELQPNQPIDVIVQSYLKQTVQDVLRDQSVQRESVQFVDRLGKQSQVQDTIVTLLKDSIQNPIFLQESQVFGKQLVLELLKDKEVEQHLLQLVLRIFNDPIVKNEVKETLKWVANEQEVRDAFIDMLKKTGDDPKFRSALSDALAYGANDVIMRKETSEKLRMFAYFLLEVDSKNDPSVKRLIDLITERVMKKQQITEINFQILRKSESSQEKEFDKILKDIYVSMRHEEIDSQRDSTPRQRTAYL